MLLLYLYMQYQSRKGIGPILAISSDPQKGLCLNWSLTGILPPSFQYYHIFLFLGKHDNESSAFFSAYCENLKLGQLIGVFLVRNDSIQRKSRILWSEKSGLNSSTPQIKKSYLFEDFTTQLIQQVIQLANKKRGLIILNIVCDSYVSSKVKINKIKTQTQAMINKVRFKYQKADKIIFNLISPFFKQSKLNCNKGFNQIHYDTQISSICCQDLLVYIRGIVLKSLTLTIQTKEKFNILSCSSKQWFICDGREIQKKYYALPRVKFCQYIKFLQIKRQSTVDFQLSLILNFTFFDDSQIRDRKNYTFETDFDKIYLKNMTSNTDIQKCVPYQFAKGVFLHTNLLKQDSYILISKITQSNYKSKKVSKGNQ